MITHGHSDHARPGHGAVLATQETLDMMRLRYGDNFAGRTQAIGYGEEIRLGDEETRRYMRVLHEEIISRIATIQEGQDGKTRNQ